MAYVVFIVVMALLVLGTFVLARVRRSRRRRPTIQNRTEPTAASVRYLMAAGDGERDESALVARRFAGDLSPARYQQEMGDLAMKDALRHPVVPPDHGC